MRRLDLLKLLSVLSALVVFFPGEKMSVPFVFFLISLAEPSRVIDKILPLSELGSILYILISTGLNWKSLLNDIVIIMMLLAFVSFLGSYYPDFVKYYNWLSTSTAILSLGIIFFTIWEIVRRRLISKKKSD